METQNVYSGQTDKFLHEYGTQGAQLYFSYICDKYNVSKKDRQVAQSILDRLSKMLLEQVADRKQEGNK